jgi:hypothetical protein
MYFVIALNTTAETRNIQTDSDVVVTGALHFLSVDSFFASFNLEIIYVLILQRGSVVGIGLKAGRASASVL